MLNAPAMSFGPEEQHSMYYTYIAISASTIEPLVFEAVFIYFDEVFEACLELKSSRQQYQMI